jgi:hypothetical protein
MTGDPFAAQGGRAVSTTFQPRQIQVIFVAINVMNCTLV